MRAITLYQPWASLVAARRKRVETRHWPPPLKLLGTTIAIHAAKTNLDAEPCRRFGYDPTGIPRGAVVAFALLTRVYRVVDHETSRGGLMFARCEGVYSDQTDERVRIEPYGDFSPGRYVWMLHDVSPLVPPVEAVGHQGIWEWKNA